MSGTTFENLIELGIKKSEQGRFDELEIVEVRE